MSTTTTTRTPSTAAQRGAWLDELFGERPWWEGTAIQYLCRLAAYGGMAIIGETGVWVLAFGSGTVQPSWLSEARDAGHAHEAEIAALLERCPGHRFPWWA